jgi:hypothetical protein
MRGIGGMTSFRLRSAQRGATQLGVLDILTAIVVLAILVYAASRQFPAYGVANPAASEQSEAH